MRDMSSSHHRFTAPKLAELGVQIGSSLVSDALDAAGLRQQTLAPGYVPLIADQVLVGYAFPVRVEATDEIPDVPYVGLLRALDAIGPGEVWVGASGGFRHASLWGELLSTACMAAGAAGAVVDGYARDRNAIRRLGFPVMCRGADPRDINGRGEVVEHRVAVEVDGVTIAAGDLVVGDDDGVVIVPESFVDEVVSAAVEKSRREGQFRQAVSRGVPPSEAFKTFGVL